jgi:hypothetical protein
MVPTSFCLLRSVPTIPKLCTDGTVGSSDGVFFLPFYSRLQLGSLLQLNILNILNMPLLIA